MATIAEKILAAHSGRGSVSPGDFINVSVDIVLANDITGPLSIREFRKLGVERVFDPSKVVMVPDHFVPNKDIPSAIQAKIVREFCREQACVYYESGRAGIEHVLLPEEGLVGPGQVIVGADSHTCTYGALGAFATGMGSTDIAMAMATGDIWMKVPPTIKFVFRGHLQPWVSGKDLILHVIGDIGIDGALYAAMEFGGDAISNLDMDGRFTMANMAIEAGGKAGLFAVDEKTTEYIAAHPPNYDSTTAREYYTDSDSDYARIIEYDAATIEPLVEHQASEQGGASACRPGGHRQLHKRSHLRPAHGGAAAQRAVRAPSREVYRHPRHTGRVPPSNRGRTDRHFHRGWRGGEHADLRTMPRRLHGCPRARGTLRFHDEPELCRSDGQPSVGGVPHRSSSSGSERSSRLYHGALGGSTS